MDILTYNLNMKKYQENYYINATKPRAAYEIGVQLTELILKSEKKLNDIVIVCIGTDRSTGDSLGPLIGHKLSTELGKTLHIYGTLDNPVHAVNLCDTLTFIENHHKNAYIIAIDASLGALDHVGYVTVGEGPLKPGLGVNKKLPDVGDLHITGIVNVSGGLDPMLLQTTRLKTVMHLAETISNGLLYCLCPARNIIENKTAITSAIACRRSLSCQAFSLLQKLKG